MTKRTVSTQAQVAKLIKAELKKHGIKCTAKSDSFSMGDSVHVNVENQPPWVMQAIEEQTDKYEYGTFDSMEDLQGFKNRDFDGPQTKYLTIQNSFTEEMKHDAWVELCGLMQELEGQEDTCPNSFYMDGAREYGSHYVWKYLTSTDKNWCYFVKPTKTLSSTPVKVEAVEATQDTICSVNYTIEQHTHTKKLTKMIICVAVGKMGKDLFNMERDRAKTLNGWYSRKWESIPNGFGFNSMDEARKFCGYEDEPTKEPVIEKPAIQAKCEVIDISTKSIVDRAIESITSTIHEPEMLVNNPTLVKEYLQLKLIPKENEVFSVMYLNNQHGLIEYKEMFQGTINAASVYPREILKHALKVNAAAVILAHNHPSGLCTPSMSDIDITSTIKKAMSLIDIRVLDHIIVGGKSTHSFAEKGQI